MNTFTSFLVGMIAGVVLSVYVGITDPANNRDLRNDAALFEQAADSMEHKDELIKKLKEENKKCQDSQSSSEKEPMNYDQRNLLGLGKSWEERTREKFLKH